MEIYRYRANHRRSRWQSTSRTVDWPIRCLYATELFRSTTSPATLFRREHSRTHCKHVNHLRQLRLSSSCDDHVHLFTRTLRAAYLFVTAPCPRCAKRESLCGRPHYIHQLISSRRCIFSGSSHPALVEAICGRLGQKRADVTLGTFSTIGETCTISQCG